MEAQAADHTAHQPSPVKDIAERMLAHHTDGTVIATAEVLGLDLQQLWDHFIQHTDPSILMRSADPVVLAYFTKSGLMVFGFCPAGSTSKVGFKHGRRGEL